MQRAQVRTTATKPNVASTVVLRALKVLSINQNSVVRVQVLFPSHLKRRERRAVRRHTMVAVAPLNAPIFRPRRRFVPCATFISSCLPFRSHILLLSQSHVLHTSGLAITRQEPSRIRVGRLNLGKRHVRLFFVFFRRGQRDGVTTIGKIDESRRAEGVLNPVSDKNK